MSRKFMNLLVLCLLGACSVESTSYYSAEVLTAGRPSPEIVKASHGILKRLSNRRLTGNELLQTDTSRLMLALLVACALDSDSTLVVTQENGAQIEFFGETGLASGWLHRPLNHNEKRWVSACVLVHLSVTELVVPVSMRGSDPALKSSQDERDIFDVEEGAFFGNIFTSADEAIDWRACSGAGQLQNPLPGALTNRTCAEVDPSQPMLTLCGFRFTGDCADICNRSHSGYERCIDDDTTFQQIITTSVAE